MMTKPIPMRCQYGRTTGDIAFPRRAICSSHVSGDPPSSSMLLAPKEKSPVVSKPWDYAPIKVLHISNHEINLADPIARHVRRVSLRAREGTDELAICLSVPDYTLAGKGEFR
jgi:hypothetical protein